MASYKKRLEERKKTRGILNNCGLRQDWLTNKSGRTELESRVLKRMQLKGRPEITIKEVSYKAAIWQTSWNFLFSVLINTLDFSSRLHSVSSYGILYSLVILCTLCLVASLRWRDTNRPFLHSPGPLFQNEGRCSAFDMEIISHSHANKTHFHKKGCAPSLILKVRVFGTWKWPIALGRWVINKV